MKDQHNPTLIQFDIACNVSSVSRYRLKVTQIPCETASQLAPPGCLTYNTELSGAISSFNYAGGTGEMINNQRFSHCIKHQEGYCDVSLAFIDFDLGLPGWISEAEASQCGCGDSVTIGSNIFRGTRNLEIDNSIDSLQIICASSIASILYF